MTTKDFAIGILSVTGVILLTGIILVHAFMPQQAMAYAQNAGGGDYLVTTSQLGETTELVVVLDTAVERMNVYVFNPRLGQIELLQPPITIERGEPREPERREPPARPRRRVELSTS